MNLIGRFYVKANFIKAAKDNWVPADVRILTDDIDTFLCIKSRPLGFGDTEEDMKSIFSDMSATATISSTRMMPQPTPGTVARPFTALCNLSEYKCCSLLSVTVNDIGHFALKLIPAGILGNKRLYLAMSSETEATTWMSVIKANLGKKRKTSQHLAQSRDSLAGTLRTAGSQDTLRADSNSNSGMRYDLEIDTIDNEVYEPCSARDLIPAAIQQRGDFDKLRLSKLDCFLRLTEDRLELLDHNGERVLHWFPYLLIRRFGAVGGVLRVDAGRRCSTGDGHFFFACSPTNGQPVDAIVSQIRQLALEAKQRLRQEQTARQNRQNFGGVGGSFNDQPPSAASTRPPPIPSKSLDSGGGSSRCSYRSPSPAADVAGGIKGGSWWNSYKRSSSIPAPKRGHLAAEEEPAVKAKEESRCSSALTSTTEKTNEDGVFIALPGKATSIECKTNGADKHSPDTHQPGLYDNVPTTDSEMSSTGQTLPRSPQHQQQFTISSPNSTRSSSESSGRVAGRNSSETWRITGPITRGLKTPLKDEDLPPAPEPPAGFRNEDNAANNISPLNGGAVEVRATLLVNSPPAIAPKPAVHNPPKTFSLNNYRKASEPSNFSWLTRMRNYRSYNEGSMNDDPSTPSNGPPHPPPLSASSNPAPTKSLTFATGVYESEDASSELSRLNLRGLDDVLQELRDANDNVSSAVQAAERQRRAHGLGTPFHTLSKPADPGTAGSVWPK